MTDGRTSRGGRSRDLVVAVDASTTGCKAIAFDGDGVPVAVGRRGIPKSSPHPGWQEQDAESWWSGTTGAISDIMAQVDRASVRAIAITHQRETFVCIDGDGRPIRPAILWLDTRAGSQVERLGDGRVHEISGKPPSTTPSLYKIAWLAEHEPEVLAAAAGVIDVHGFLVSRLTGRFVTTWAAADPMGIVDMRTFEYDAGLVALAGLTLDQLPSLAPPGSVLGEVTAAAARATGLPAGLPVVGGAGDGQCAGLGAAVVRPDLAYLNLGTGVTLGTHAQRYEVSRAFRALSSPIAGSWTFESLLASGVLSVAWFASSVAEDTAPGAEQRLEAEAARVAPGADGLLFLPYLTSAETPYWDTTARGAWVGLREHHGRAHLYRAILEGIAFEQRLVLGLIEAATAEHVVRLRAMGGGAQSGLLVQILADILERPIERTNLIETTALGAGILAAAAVGLDGESDVAMTAQRMTGCWTAVEPSLAVSARYSRRYELYARLYPALAPLYRDLADDEEGP